MLSMELESLLMTLPNVSRISNKHITTRCPFCGDSKKNSNKKRFYILCEHNSDSPFMYYCFNCNEKGILTTNTLKLFKISNSSINSQLTSFNNSISIKKKVKSDTEPVEFKYPKVIPTEETEKQLKYLNERLGINEDYMFWVMMKSIFSLKSLKKFNNEIDVDDNNVYVIDKYYASFLTNKNSHLISRHIDESDYKHRKTKLIKNLSDSILKYYSIPNGIDIVSPNLITINIAEGVYDILGVFCHIKEREVKDNLYFAVTGSGYKSVILDIISRGIIGNVKLNIFSDQDKDLNYYKYQLDNLHVYFNSIDIYYNTKSKDFGVPKSEIEYSKFKIK